MSGTREGGLLAVQTNRARYGMDFYRQIGSAGGKVRGLKKGFAADKKRAKWAGFLGGATTMKKAGNELQPKTLKRLKRMGVE